MINVANYTSSDEFDISGKEFLTPQQDKICIVFVKMTIPLNDSNIIRAELSDVQFLPVSQK